MWRFSLFGAIVCPDSTTGAVITVPVPWAGTVTGYTARAFERWRTLEDPSSLDCGDRAELQPAIDRAAVEYLEEVKALRKLSRRAVVPIQPADGEYRYSI